MQADEATEKREELYAETRKDLLTRQLSNSEKFDGAILTLSTAALGTSLSFIKDIVPLKDATHMAWLIGSWWLFGSAIVSTLLSFVASQLGIRRQLVHAAKYYLEGREEYLKKRNMPAIATEILNYFSATLFFAALASTILFVSANLEGKTMADSKVPLKEGATIPNMQPVSSQGKVEKGAPVPNLRPAPSNPGQAGGGQTGGGQSSGGGGGSGGQSGSGSGSGRGGG